MKREARVSICCETVSVRKEHICVRGFLHSLHNNRQETGRKLLNWKEAYLRIQVFKPELQEAVKAGETAESGVLGEIWKFYYIVDYDSSNTSVQVVM